MYATFTLQSHLYDQSHIFFMPLPCLVFAVMEFCLCCHGVLPCITTIFSNKPVFKSTLLLLCHAINSMHVSIQVCHNLHLLLSTIPAPYLVAPIPSPLLCCSFAISDNNAITIILYILGIHPIHPRYFLNP